MSLDRVNNDLGYSAANCRWATDIEQARNKRNTKLTIDLAVQIAVRRLKGERAQAIADDFGISSAMIYQIVKCQVWPEARGLAYAQMALEASAEDFQP